MYRGEIVITLKSDLCTGSGYSFAGIVDSDVSYDEDGLPYIPGKRLKGCFREVAETILYKLYDSATITCLFGKAGSREEGKLRVGNAYIRNYIQLKQQLKAKEIEDPGFIDSQVILDLFTHTIGQTEIEENGVAKRTSLRFTRVINHYNPIDEASEMSFVAEIKADVDESVKNAIEDIVHCTRNIGLKRNRGLGSVKCHIELHKEEIKAEIPLVQGSESIIAVPVVIENIEPLMLSGEKEDVSESYVRGQALIGMLAGRYLKIPGKKPEDETFYDLFLNGKVRYTNLYPCIHDEVYYPVPDYINRLKKTKKIVNVLLTDKTGGEDDSAYDMRNGNQPKKIKGSFAYINEDMSMLISEVKKEIVYHHSHYKKNSDGETGILYGMEVVSPGQVFKGYIYTPEKYAGLLKYLLQIDDLYFGKSRSAQYGRTVLLKDHSKHVKTLQECMGKTEYNRGEYIAIDFLSDTILLNQESSEYTVYKDEVRGVLLQELDGKIEDIDEPICYLKTGKITGYSGIWNLRRTPIPCIKGGSSVVMQVKDDCILPDYTFIGERTFEGCGQIAIRKINKMKFRVDVEETLSTTLNVCGDEADIIFAKIKKEYWLQTKKKEYLNMACPNITSSGLGRLTLMLKESINESKDYKNQYQRFSKRIESIKSGKLKNAGKELVSLFGDGNSFTWLNREFANNAKRDEYSKLWTECLMTSLVIWKYDKAGDDNE